VHSLTVIKQAINYCEKKTIPSEILVYRGNTELITYSWPSQRIANSSHQNNYCGKWIEMNRNVRVINYVLKKPLAFTCNWRDKCSTADAGQDPFLRRGLCLQETSGNVRLQHAVIFRTLL